MDHLVSYWLPGVIGLVAAYFFLIPLLILASQRFRADVDILPFDLVQTPPPEALAWYFHETDAALTGLGFCCLGGYALPNPMPNVQAVLQIYVHQSNRDVALVSAIFGSQQDSSRLMQCRYVEFMARFATGTVRIVQTNNAPQAGSFPSLLQDLTFRFPHVQDLARLYKLHQALIQRHAVNQRKTVRVVDEYRGDCVRYLRDAALRETFQEQEQTGYLRYGPVQDAWVPTIKGAYLMTWRELWPIKPWIRARIRRRAHELESDLLARPILA